MAEVQQSATLFPDEPSSADRPARPAQDAKARSRDRAEISELERKRIGREFHDGIGQRLTSVSIAASLLAEKLEAKSLPEAADARKLLKLIQEAVRDARNLAQGLYPAALFDKGLEKAVDGLLTQITETTSMSTTLQIDNWVDIDDGETNVHVFRIVQEAANNAIKHSGGTHVVVRMGTNNRDYCVDVVDNGRGLPSDYESLSGMGIGLMNQRARLLGGTLVVGIRERGGTCVRLSFTR